MSSEIRQRRTAPAVRALLNRLERGYHVKAKNAEDPTDTGNSAGSVGEAQSARGPESLSPQVCVVDTACRFLAHITLEVAR